MRMLRLFLIISLYAVIFSCANKQMVDKPVIDVNTVDKMEITKATDSEYMINLKSDSNFRYEVYEKKPNKLVLNLFEVVFDPDLLKKKYSDSFIDSVDYISGANNSKVIFTLKGPFEYNHHSKGKSLSLSIKEKMADIEFFGKDEKVEAEEVLPAEIRKAAKITGITNLSSDGEVNLVIGLDGIARYDYGYLTDTKMYVDLFDIRKDFSGTTFNGKGAVKSIKINEYYPPQKVRFLIDVAGKVPVFAGQDGKNLTITSNMMSAPEDKKYIATMDAVSYRNVQSVVINFIGRVKYEKKIVNSALHIVLEDDVKLLGNVSSYQVFKNKPFKKVQVVKVDGKTSIVFIPNGDIFATVDETPEGLLVSSSFEEFSKADLELAPKEVPAETIDSAIDKVVKSDSDKVVSAQDKITLNITDMDVREAIRLLFYGRETNLVFGAGVNGKVTLYLKDVDYKTALNFIMEDQSLAIVPKDNIIWIITKARQASIVAQKTKAVKDEADKELLEPLVMEIVPVNFSTAGALQGIISPALSKRGKITIDTRTNSFIIRDTRKSIVAVKRLLKEVDKRTPQVTIEARIVEVKEEHQVDIGIQWGGHWNKIDNSTTFPNSLNLTGATDLSGNSGAYMVNIPVSSPAGALALTLGHSTGLFNLDIALSALETQDKAKTISSPRITTLDNMEAEIKSGNTAVIVPSGDNTDAEEIETGILLKVKPHITANSMVFLEIEVEKSSLGSITSSTVTSEEKKAKTNVLLANGETTVIGGLYEDERKDVETGIPGLSKIPVLGWLFKGKKKIVTKRELLVFITPYVEN